MRSIILAAVCLLSWVAPSLAAGIEPVRIEGYTDEAMEPFVSRDGRYLFWNTRNDPGANADIHFAELDRGTYVYRGVLLGTTSYDLDGTPTMSADGHFCFISPREYRRALISVYCGIFNGKRVTVPEAQAALPGERMGRIIFDVELAPDGQSMIFAEGTFSGGAVPDAADIFLATMGPHGFKRSTDSNWLFAAVNTDALEYAPAITADGLELFFTRVTGIWPFSSPHLFRATRPALDKPFGLPVRLNAPEGFVEGPSVGPDGMLYFHKKVDGRFEIWRIPR